MAALHEGVKIEVISNGAALPMYDDPDAVESDSSTPQHYIEAITGATFSVRVTLTSNFEKGPCDAVRIAVNYDGEPVDRVYDVLKQHHFPPKRDAHFVEVNKFDPLTGLWFKAKPSFARLDTKDTNDVTGVEVARVQSLGKIAVKVTRVQLLGTFENPWFTPPKRVSEIPEKMLKGRPIDNTIDFRDTSPSTVPRGSERIRAISGPLSKPVNANILYRSRRGLQSIGCIPRSPSPESSPAGPNPEEEIQQLRSRLALLERSTNVKSEARNGTGSIKRERQDAETPASRKKPRRDASIEVVDLTDD